MVTPAKDLTLCRGRSVFFHHNSVKTYADPVTVALLKSLKQYHTSAVSGRNTLDYSFS